MKYFFLLVLSIAALTGFSRINIPETPFTEYVFPSKECKLIQHHQSRIFVPANCFYLDGKLYEGEVHLKYREFVDQLDIIVNHIPMNYAENDKHHLLESAGMFEMYAYGNGKLLSFAPQKKIGVQLANKFDITGGETYVLNKQTSTWEKKTPFGKSPESNGVLSENKDDLWGDHLPQNDNDFITTRKIDSIYVVDPSTGMNMVQVMTYTYPGNVFKTMNVDKFDFYNCDRILEGEAVPVIADFKLTNINQKLNSEVYVVYKKRNAVITYYPDQFETTFKLLPDEDFTIFTYDVNGKIAVLDNQFTSTFDVKANKGKKVIFPLKVFARNPLTKEELAKITGL